jgi:hypothetical protein
MCPVQNVYYEPVLTNILIGLAFIWTGAQDGEREQCEIGG